MRVGGGNILTQEREKQSICGIFVWGELILPSPPSWIPNPNWGRYLAHDWILLAAEIKLIAAGIDSHIVSALFFFRAAAKFRKIYACMSK